MLGNIAPLWEVILAAIKCGAVIIPASTLLGPGDITDRITRGDVRHVITESAQAPKFGAVAGARWTPIAVGEPADGWLSYDDAFAAAPQYTPDGVTLAGDPLLLYFTSGTTAQPKLVEHTHASYPAGHLSTMYWLGLQPGDVHLNVSSPGWAKHAWSNVFAPWNAAATVMVLGHERFSVERAARGHPGLRHQLAVRAADGVADADPVRPVRLSDTAEPARVHVGRGTAQPGGDRGGPGGRGGSRCGTATGRPRRPRRSATRRARRSGWGSMGRPLPGYTVVTASIR